MADLSKNLTSLPMAVPLSKRSVSLPLRPAEPKDNRRSSLGQSSPDPVVETLFAYSNVKIVSFTAALTSYSDPRGSSRRELSEEIGNLAWTSRMERILAIGPFRIYRAPGSVAFLSCGTVLKPIFPKTTCWCVDDYGTKFVMQMRKPEYWRIEMTGLDIADTTTSNELRAVLFQISLFEKTHCPFRRNFTVDLPLTPLTPPKKRPWQPVRTSTPDPNPGQHTDPILGTTAAASIYSTNDYKSQENAEQHTGTTLDPTGTASTNSSQEYKSQEKDIDNASETMEDISTPRPGKHLASAFPLIAMAEETKYSQSLQASRSLTAPPQLTLVTSPPSKNISEQSPLRRSFSRDSTTSDISSSDADSFHTVQSWHSPITPHPLSPQESDPDCPSTYPFPHENIAFSKRPNHSREVSEITVTPGTVRMSNSVASLTNDLQDDCIPPVPPTPILTDDIGDNLDEEHFQVATPPTITRRIRHRATTSSNSNRRALSPLPSAANIFSPRRVSRRLQTTRHIPTAIIQKTCEILLSPPSHLLNLMLDIATRIRAGEWRGVVFGFGESGEKIESHWDYDAAVLSSDNWGDDDYGTPCFQSNDRRKSMSTRHRGGSWEID